MDHAMQHCHRPWWKRPPFWFVLIGASLTVLFVVITERPGKPLLTPYSVFLDQVDAGNVEAVTFQGTQIDGHYKHRSDGASSSDAAPPNAFASRVPDFGDPALISALRKQHVVIDVALPSQWTALLARIPWPMLFFLSVAMVAGFFKLLHGGSAQPGSAAATLPAHGMMGLVSRLFLKQGQPANPQANDGDDTKSR